MSSNPSRAKRSAVANSLAASFPVTLNAAALQAAHTLDDMIDEAPAPIAFDPVPRRRRRKNGWTEELQREFIACLQRSGSVTLAARAVGKSARTAYKLLDVDGAESFAMAWDKAVNEGLARLRQDSIGRALNGSLVPVYRRGRLVRVEHRRNDRLAIALLGNRDNEIDRHRHNALRRHAKKMEWQAIDRAAEERKQREIDAKQAYDEEIQRILDIALERDRPRITRL
jgi:hypothetical protein